MNPNRLVVGCRFCALLVATWMAAEKVSGDSWVAVNAEGAVTVQHILAAQAPKLDVHGYDANRIDLVVTTLGLGLEPRTTKAGEFVKLTWPDSPAYGEVGTPALPAVRRLFVAPMDADVRVSVMEGDPAFVDTQTVGFPLRVLPVQPPIPKWPGARARAEFVFDQLAYGVNQNLLPERAVVKELGIVRGQRLFLLEVRPVDYNPVAQVLTLWPNIEAEIEFVGKSSSRSKLTSLPGLHHILLNPDLDAPAERGSDNYLIVVADAFEMDIAVFAAAKVAQGFTVTTHVVSAGTSNDVIKAYIENQWSDPGTAPDYVLLVGDTNSIPYWVGDGTGSPDTDLPYACMDGPGDWYPDIAIGRFPVDTSADVQAMVDKTLYYENGVLIDPAYKKRAVFMASVDNYQISEGTHEYVINTHLEPYGHVADRLYQVTYGATTEDVTDSFNDGRFYGIYSGHGSTYSWGDGPPFSQGNINSLTNENMYSMICSFACLTGIYTVDECFMETWVLAPNKGAVTSWGSSVSSFWGEDDILEKRLFDTIFDNEDDVKTEIGPVYNEAKMRYLAHYGPTTTTRRYFEMYNLMGDPSLRLPGGCSDAGEVGLDRTEYACESTAQLEVSDCGLNLGNSQIDTVQVTIESDSEPGGESVTLYETEAASARFQGSVTLSETDAAGVLLIAEGDTVTATYLDADNGQGGYDVEVMVSAVVDCQPPHISNVQVTDITPRNATVTFDTDEPVMGIVHYGESCDTLTGSATSASYIMPATVRLGGLSIGTTYFYVVQADDETGNTSDDDNGGACYSLTTLNIPGLATEEFEGDFDLAYVSILLTPNAYHDYYTGCSQSLSSLPTSPSGATVLNLWDDDYVSVMLSGGEAVSLYGTSYWTFYVGSNGYVTFGSGDYDWLPSLEHHFSMARIAGLFNDFDPSVGGTVSWQQFDDRAVVTWLDVPEHDTGNSSTFQIEMYFNGKIRISYLDVAASSGIAGLSEGVGLAPSFLESDLSAMTECECYFASPVRGDPEPNPSDNGFGTKNRYLTFVGGEPGREQAVRVTFTSVPDHEYAEGRTMWVQEPIEVSEAASSSADHPPPTFWAATLDCIPVYTDWSMYDAVDVYDGAVVPGATFDVQIIDETCQTTDEEQYSHSLSVDLSVTGDVVGLGSPGDTRDAPQGVVDFQDIASLVRKFKNDPGSIRKTRGDIMGNGCEDPMPNFKVDFIDITQVVDAFRGEACPPVGPPVDDPCPGP